MFTFIVAVVIIVIIVLIVVRAIDGVWMEDAPIGGGLGAFGVFGGEVDEDDAGVVIIAEGGRLVERDAGGFVEDGLYELADVVVAPDEEGIFFGAWM